MLVSYVYIYDDLVLEEAWTQKERRLESLRGEREREEIALVTRPVLERNS